MHCIWEYFFTRLDISVWSIRKSTCLLHANPFRDSGIYRYHQLFTFLPTDFICISYDIQNRQILLSCAALTIRSVQWGLFSEVLPELRSYSLHWVSSIVIRILLVYERTSLLHSDWWHRTLCSANSRDKSTVCRLCEIVRSGMNFSLQYANAAVEISAKST